MLSNIKNFLTLNHNVLQKKTAMARNIVRIMTELTEVFQIAAI